MEFLKTLFEAGALTWEQFSEAAKQAGFEVINAGYCQVGLSQILCKHRNAVQIEQNLFKAEAAQAAAALFSK